MKTPPLKHGDSVRRNHPCDGTWRAGMPSGPVLVIARIEDHRPCDGPVQENAIAIFSDKTWAFVWNLTLA